MNNAGVSLLQRRLYSEAVDTLKDALRLMRFAFFSGESSMPSADDFDRALRASSQRTSITQAKGQDNILLVMITDQDSPYSVCGEFERCPEIMFCVNLEPVDWDCDYERLEAESALLLYNYGIAHRCAAQSNATQCDHATRSHINDTAFQIFAMAQSVAGKLLSVSDLVEPPSNVLFVSFLITSNLYQMSSHSLELSQQYSEDLEELLVTIAEREMMVPLEEIVSAAAA